MNILMMLVVVIGVLALLGTVLLGGKGDNNYDKKTKGNISRLSLIYIILAISIIIAFAIYLF